MRVHAVRACPACGGERFLAFGLGGANELHRCTACGTVSAKEYADPSEVYRDGYMFGETSFGLDVRHPLFQRYLARVAHRRLDFIEGLTGERGRLLDVGCGTGEVLMAAHDRGWRVQGVEPERTAADMARDRGVDVKVSLLEESGLPEGSYDVVTAFHVLEHMADCRSFLRTLARWARPGGHVTVEVPNFHSVQRRKNHERWIHLRPLEHIVHFAPDTLERTIRGAGLEPVKLRSPAYLGPPQNLDHAVADLGRGPRFRRLMAPLSPLRPTDGAKARVPGRLGWAVLRSVEALYDRAGVGSVVLALARRP